MMRADWTLFVYTRFSYESEGAGVQSYLIMLNEPQKGVDLARLDFFPSRCSTMCQPSVVAS